MADHKSDTTNQRRLSTWMKVKLGLAALGVVLLVIIVLQNTAPVQTRLLFLDVVMPNALLLLVTLLIGFALGVIVASLLSRRR